MSSKIDDEEVFSGWLEGHLDAFGGSIILMTIPEIKEASRQLVTACAWIPTEEEEEDSQVLFS